MWLIATAQPAWSKDPAVATYVCGRDGYDSLEDQDSQRKPE